VLELEGLRMAVQGKASGWEALRAYESHIGREKLDALLAGAHEQLATLARLHAAAVQVLRPVAADG
jgi:hypothetical protein